MAKTDATQDSSDGRIQRGVRNRAAIVEALFELIQKNGREPTAKEVADCAGVQARTVFRHFQDMASLSAELSARMASEILPLLNEVGPEGALEERIETMARVRAQVFERVTPFKHVSRAQILRFEHAREDQARMVGALRANLFRVFPEFKKAQAPTASMLEMIFSFEAWDRLRSDQKLTVNQAKRAIEQAAVALAADASLL